MAKFVFDTGDWVREIAMSTDLALSKLFPIMKMALYEGADVIANAAKKAANAHGLGAGLGVATFKTDADGPQTSVGFRDGGYFVNRWGQTVPYDLAANVLEYGSSRVPGTHFMTHAFKSAKAKAQAAMRAKFQEEINKMLGV